MRSTTARSARAANRAGGTFDEAAEQWHRRLREKSELTIVELEFLELLRAQRRVFEDFSSRLRSAEEREA